MKEDKINKSFNHLLLVCALKPMMKRNVLFWALGMSVGISAQQLMTIAVDIRAPFEVLKKLVLESSPSDIFKDEQLT